ncbi:MAG: hypothetical protein U0637_03155 [Phycisphaerales bacterium]
MGLQQRWKQWRRRVVLGVLGVCGVAAAMGLQTQPPSYVVLAANDLGMHCMQNDFSQMMILPPFNTLRAQVIHRGSEPSIVTNASVSFELPTNTHSSDKTNFWQYAQQLLGAAVPSDVGVAGVGMRGSMTADTTRRDFAATGIPVTPIDDDGKENPYPLALITAKNSSGTTLLAQTQAVVPVSWEMSCNLCHNTPGESTATNILMAHDRLHGTNLIAAQPVMCASCHADNALGTAGQPGVPNLSAAMHGAHASRMGQVNMANSCYACHPGVRTNCQRDYHASQNITCTDCHGSMATVASPSRNPWVDLPRCSMCHTRQGFEFEQAGVRYRDSKGHGGVLCVSCHGSPHATGPAVNALDNLQANRVQGHAGPVDTCLVCHTSQPSESFFHRQED